MSPFHCRALFGVVLIASSLVLTDAIALTNSSRPPFNYTTHRSGDYSSAYHTGLPKLPDTTSDTLATSSGLGDYIASGLGLVISTVQNSATETETPPLNTSIADSAEETCWTQWGSYWESAASSTQSVWSEFTTVTSANYYSTTYTAPTTRLSLITDFENGRVWRTRTFTNTRTKDIVIEPVSTYATWVERWGGVPAYTDLATPDCDLPTSIPRCQSQWDDWVLHQTADRPSFTYTKSCNYLATDNACLAQSSSAGSFYSSWNSAATAPSPGCTQASVDQRACDSLISKYTSIQGLQSSMTISGYTWPATKSVAVGCTVGCQSCRITGGQVELIYWPPTSTANMTATRTADSVVMVTAQAFNTTFTSPTVYISFDSLYASDSCSGIGTTFHNTIIPITNPTELSSIWGWNRGGYLMSESFNFTDLYVTPVPDSIYNRQPRCASLAGVYNNNGFRSGFVCDYDSEKDFRPRLVVPSEVRNLDPAWATCLGSLEGVYDPPVALKPATAIAVPTKGPDPVQTVSAEPETLTTAPAPSTPPPSSAEQPTTRISVPASSEAPVSQSPPDKNNQPTNDPSSQASSVASNVASSGSGSDGNSQPAAVPDPDHAPTRNPGNVAASSKSLIEPTPPAVTGANPESDEDPGSGPGMQPTKTQHPDKTRSVDALSVLSEALVSLASPSRTNGVQPQYDPAGSSNVKTIALPSTEGATVTWTANGQKTYTASREGDTVIVTSSDGQSVNVTEQDSAILEGQTIRIVPEGVAIQTAGNPTGSSSTLTATWTVGGKTYTAVRIGDVTRVTSSAGQSVVLTASGTASLDGQTFRIVDDSLVISDSRTVSFSMMATSATLAAVWTNAGHTFSAMQQNSNIILVDGSQTYNLPRGSATTVNGEIISAAASAPLVVVDGSRTLSVSPHSTPATQNEQILTLGDHFVTMSRSGGSVVLYDDSTTVTGKRGDVVTVDGHVISIPSSANMTGLVQLDGTATANDPSPTDSPTTGAAYTGGASQTIKQPSFVWMIAIVTVICLSISL